MTPFLLELHGRWSDFDPSVWWHWVFLGALVAIAAWAGSGKEGDR